MESTEKARKNHHRMEQMPKEETSQLIPGLNPEEDEDFLSGLNPEEKECLGFLIQTINNLDKEVSEDNEWRHEETEGSLGSQDQCQHHVICSMPQQSKFGEDAPWKPAACPAVTKSKMIKSHSVECDEIALRRWSDLYHPPVKFPPRLANSHPTHLKKFDTILKSGVNVQELRSRFLHHHDSSAPVKQPAKDSVRRLSSAQRSMRDEALHKLGFLQRDEAFQNAHQCIQLPCAERPDKEATAGSSHMLKKYP
ncbi:uncharacterized protein LOC113447634 [Pseudonaja textilis]|uniref:uncharacterized protein LOC113447634 n=1 Tax=Pseudonaja textilis TaxID=8673 RepID=UPI000EA9E7AC|nr:uncharacterized protein LOC113447634 [Pseudonaja textilis]XP_026573719.1 uncharacterized protein LOC113447634 [Pseudonaja textilis]